MLPREELRVDGRLPSAYWVGMALKVCLVLLLLVPLLRPELEQYDDKGMSWRILVFPLAALAIPVVWRLTGSRPPYPYLADCLIVIPPLTDVLWNTIDTYDRIAWWDGVNHLVNSLLFATVIGLIVGRQRLGAATVFGLALGLGMTLQVMWEIGEYLTFLTRHADDADLYADTIKDLSLDLVGSLLGAALAVAAVRSATAEDEADVAPAAASQLASR
jgi:hypothetical protein